MVPVSAQLQHKCDHCWDGGQMAIYGSGLSEDYNV